jgi:lactam utilization protein B
VVLGIAFAERRGVSVGAIGAAVEQGRLFGVTIRRRRYDVAALLDVDSTASDAVCLARVGLNDSEKAIVWMRPHGALAGRTVADAVSAGELAKAVALAHVRAAGCGFGRQERWVRKTGASD